uniref:Uncharacterized protein n=1 Tax=Rhizophora mucronata TaxID=61149 RepID=A0A2P2R1U5_RHIMU
MDLGKSCQYMICFLVILYILELEIKSLQMVFLFQDFLCQLMSRA